MPPLRFNNLIIKYIAELRPMSNQMTRHFPMYNRSKKTVHHQHSKLNNLHFSIPRNNSWDCFLTIALPSWFDNQILIAGNLVSHADMH